MAAISFLPQELLTMVAAGFVARLVAKIGTPLTLLCGMISFGTGLFLLTYIHPSLGYMYGVLPGTLLIGLGAAMVLVSGSIAATVGIRQEQQGLASGLWNTGPQIGTALGIAIVMAVSSPHANKWLIQSENINIAELSLSVNGYKTAFAAAILLAVVGLCSALLSR